MDDQPEGTDNSCQALGVLVKTYLKTSFYQGQRILLRKRGFFGLF